MAVTYACDQCGHEAESLTGWYLTAVQLLYEDPIKPSPPGDAPSTTSIPTSSFTPPFVGMRGSSRLD